MMIMKACRTFKWIAGIGLICIIVGPTGRKKAVLGKWANLAEATTENALSRRNH